MARYSAGITTGAGSSTLPIISLYGVASTGARIVEIGVTNTTAVSVGLKIVRLSTAGTSSAITSFLEYDESNGALALCTPRGTHSSTGPTITQSGYFQRLGAAIGSGVIWTFGDGGLVVTVGTANGIGVIPTTTGQICDAYIVWYE
jgi:hypothetical protein